jgi:hypothetical protein
MVSNRFAKMSELRKTETLTTRRPKPVTKEEEIDPRERHVSTRLYLIGTVRVDMFSLESACELRAIDVPIVFQTDPGR